MYRYANNRNHLCKRIVFARSGTDPNRMLPNIDQSSKRSILFNLIGTIMERNNKVPSLIGQDFIALLGNGLNANFWNDNWIGCGSFKLISPLSLALARVKEEPVVDYKHWDQGVWHWMVELRRQTFDWKTEIWEEFCNTLNGVYLDENISDRIVWILKPSGMFSCKSFKKELNLHVPATRVWKSMCQPWLGPSYGCSCMDVFWSGTD